jgi:hypothetical protein
MFEVGLLKFSLPVGDLCIVRGRAGAIETTGRGPIAGCCIATAVIAGRRGRYDKAMVDGGPLASSRMRSPVSCYRKQGM